jgi:hypothetical protein
VEVQQCMELTGTNRSRAYPKNSTHQSDVKLRCLVRILWRGPERQTQICFVSSFQVIKRLSEKGLIFSRSDF